MSGDATVDVSALQKELRSLGRKVEDLSAFTPIAAEILVGHVNDEWESAGRGKWAPLAPSTLYRRRKRGRGAQILKDTGRAVASVQADAGPDWARASTDVSYMVYHVSDAARTVIPLRNPFVVEDVALPDVIDALQDYIAGEA